jgi:hypothetical protein
MNKIILSILDAILYFLSTLTSEEELTNCIYLYVMHIVNHTINNKCVVVYLYWSLNIHAISERMKLSGHVGSMIDVE